MQVEEWLAEIGMSQYVDAFHKERITIDVVSTLTHEDLKKLGVRTLGDRKRLISAIAARKPLTAANAARQGDSPDERRVVTILFVDLTDYTGLSNRLDSEDLGYLQRRFWTVMGDIVADHGGTLKNRPGDALAAVFGFPVAHGNDSIRAAAAAIKMHAAISGLSEELRDALGLDEALHVHIGITIGEAYTGPPDPEFDEYYVVGEYLNLASRLSQIARPGETLISEPVHRALRHLAHCGPLESRSIRGFPAPVAVRSLLGLDPAAPRYENEPFVGRRALLERAEAILDDCLATHRGHTLILRGLPGIGKTRLLYEVEQRARHRRFAVHRVCVVDFGARPHLAPVRALIYRLLKIPLDAGRTARREILDHLFEHAAVDGSLRVFANDLLDVTQPPELATQFDAMDLTTRKQGRREAFSFLVRYSVTSRPTLIAFEDVHWADDDTLDILAALGRSARDGPLLLVLTTRIETAMGIGELRLPDIPRDLFSEEVIEALDGDETRELANILMPFDRDTVDATSTRSQGNPFFLVQLALQIHESARDRVPDTVRELIQGRIARLPTPEREALQVASVIGTRFRLDMVTRLLGNTPFEYELLEQRMFVRRVGEEMEFLHELLRATVYDSLSRSRRRSWHGRVAAALGADAPELRARHLELADSPDAPAAYREAAEKLYFEHRYEAALGLVESGLALLPGGRTLVDLMMIKAEILGLLGRYADARDLFAHTGEVCDDDATRCQCLVKAAENGCRLEEFPPALDRLAQAEALAARLELKQLLSDIHFRRGEIHYMLSDFDRCLQDQEKAYELANLSGSFEALSHAFQGMGFVHYQRGRILTSQGYFERCVEHARRSDQERLAVQILHMTGYGRYAALDLEGALRIGREAVASGERIGCRRTVMNAGRLCAYILLEMGHLDASRTMLETSLAIASAITARRYEPILNAVLARIHALQGERARAVELAERACHDSLSSNPSYMGPSVLGTLAVVSPDPSRQDWALQQGLRLLSSESPSHNHLWFHRDAITVAIRRGVDDMARRHARSLEDYTWSEPLPWATFHVEKGRWLGRAVAGERTIEVRDALRRLERQAVQTGLAMEGAEIRGALERHWAG